MKRFLIYTKLRIKAVLKIFPAMCIMTLFLCLALGGMLYLQSSRSAGISQGDEDERIGIGIVGIDSSGALGAAFPLLKNMDSSSSEADFIQFDTKREAASAIRSGRIIAAIVIPENTAALLLSGQTDRMTILFPGSSAGLEALVMRELGDSVSAIIGSMNSASNTLAEYYTLSGTHEIETITNAQTDLLITAVQDMLHRKNLFHVRYVRSQQQLSIESFYLVSMVLLLFLLMGIMCAGSFIRSDYALARLLKLRSLSASGQIFAEYLSLCVLLFSLSAVFLPLIGLALSYMPITFSAFGVTVSTFRNGFLYFSMRAIPVILLAASIDLLLYELSENIITGVLLHFLVMIALAYASGLFYTAQTMPRIMKRLQPALPTGQALLYLQYTAKARSFCPERLVPVLIWTIVLLLVSCILRKNRISGKGGVQ